MKLSEDSKIYLEPFAMSILRDNGYLYVRRTKDSRAINLYICAPGDPGVIMRLKYLYGGTSYMARGQVATWTVGEPTSDWMIRQALAQDRNFVLAFMPHPIPSLLKKVESNDE